MDFFECYEKEVKPTIPTVELEVENADELFEVENEPKPILTDELKKTLMDELKAELLKELQVNKEEEVKNE